MEKIMKDPKKKGQFEKIKELAPLYEKHRFWDTQPIVHLAEGKKEPETGVIEHKQHKDIRETPLALPEGFVWSVVDISNDKDMEEVRGKKKNVYSSMSCYGITTWRITTTCSGLTTPSHSCVGPWELPT